MLCITNCNIFFCGTIGWKVKGLMLHQFCCCYVVHHKLQHFFLWQNRVEGQRSKVKKRRDPFNKRSSALRASLFSITVQVSTCNLEMREHRVKGQRSNVAPILLLLCRASKTATFFFWQLTHEIALSYRESYARFARIKHIDILGNESNQKKNSLKSAQNWAKNWANFAIKKKCIFFIF